MKHPKPTVGRPKQDEVLDAQIHLRLSMDRKNHYVRFLKQIGRKLSGGIIEVMDEFTGYKPAKSDR